MGLTNQNWIDLRSTNTCSWKGWPQIFTEFSGTVLPIQDQPMPSPRHPWWLAARPAVGGTTLLGWLKSDEIDWPGPSEQKITNTSHCNKAKHQLLPPSKIIFSEVRNRFWVPGLGVPCCFSLGAEQPPASSSQILGVSSAWIWWGIFTEQKLEFCCGYNGINQHITV